MGLAAAFARRPEPPPARAGGVNRIAADRSAAQAARLLARPEVGALLVVEAGAEPTGGAVVGLLTARDLFRAVAAEGPAVYDRCVWLITDPDFPAIDVAASAGDRLQAFCDRGIERFRKIDIHARSASEVYAGVDLAPEHNAGFLRESLARMPSVRFAERTSGRVYALFEAGRLAGLDREVLARVAADPATRAALRVAGLPDAAGDIVPVHETLLPARTATLGAWGPDAASA